MPLVIILVGGDDNFIASTHPAERTSSRIPFFFPGIVSHSPGENGADGAEHGSKLARWPGLDLLIAEVSVRTGEA